MLRYGCDDCDERAVCMQSSYDICGEGEHMCMYVCIISSHNVCGEGEHICMYVCVCVIVYYTCVYVNVLCACNPLITFVARVSICVCMYVHV